MSLLTSLTVAGFPNSIMCITFKMLVFFGTKAIAERKAAVLPMVSVNVAPFDAVEQMHWVELSEGELKGSSKE